MELSRASVRASRAAGAPPLPAGGRRRRGRRRRRWQLPRLFTLPDIFSEHPASPKRSLLDFFLPLLSDAPWAAMTSPSPPAGGGGLGAGPGSPGHALVAVPGAPGGVGGRPAVPRQFAGSY